MSERAPTPDELYQVSVSIDPQLAAGMKQRIEALKQNARMELQPAPSASTNIAPQDVLGFKP